MNDSLPSWLRIYVIVFLFEEGGGGGIHGATEHLHKGAVDPEGPELP